MITQQLISLSKGNSFSLLLQSRVLGCYKINVVKICLLLQLLISEFFSRNCLSSNEIDSLQLVNQS